jgi:hypothetical protein
MTRLARVAVACALGLAAAAPVAVASAVLALASLGVLTTSAPAWTTELRVAGLALRVNVVGLVRLATLPGVVHLLDGRTLPTRQGTVSFAREGDRLRARCAPCQVRHPELAARPLQLRSVALDVARSADRLDGNLTIDGVRIPFVARLRAGSIEVDWWLPPTELAQLLAAVDSAVPEAAFARIEGEVEANGTLSLPAGGSRVHWSVHGIEVGGLGTEPLQYGWFRFACPQREGAPKLVISGDGERNWLAADAMGAYLAAAVIAAEDQRFQQHAGYDAQAVAEILADMQDGRPRRGASTVTQQLARTLFTGGERTAARKLRELLYALEMERTLGKARILELYLNTVHWGPGVCGARAAARVYFNKPPARLSAIEAAWLASALPDPHRAWDEQFALRRPDRTRAADIVDQMRDWPKRQRRRFAAQPLVFAPAAARGTTPSAPPVVAAPVGGSAAPGR